VTRDAVHGVFGLIGVQCYTAPPVPLLISGAARGGLVVPLLGYAICGAVPCLRILAVRSAAACSRESVNELAQC